MAREIIVANDFYRDPYEARRFALANQFNVAGNYPGMRTKPLLNDRTKFKIEKLVGQPVTHWFDDYCGSFQRVWAESLTWIHADKYNDWAAVCYLHPDPPSGSGTGFFSYEGRDRAYPDLEDPCPDDPNWVMTDYVENKWNRIVLYRGSLYHKAMGYFGDANVPETNRLFQVFFFNT